MTLLYPNNVLHYEILNNSSTAVIGISQSGNSVAAIEAIKKLKKEGYPVIALTQDLSSDTAKNAGCGHCPFLSRGIMWSKNKRLFFNGIFVNAFGTGICIKREQNFGSRI